MSKSRIALFQKVIYEGPIDNESFESFRQLSFAGIPDCDQGLRSMCWKILLNYLPFDKREEWPMILKTQRAMYYSFVGDFLKEPQNPQPPSEANLLSLDPASEFYKFHQDLKILEDIDRDVKRTLPEFAFFQLPIINQDNETPNVRLNSNRAFFKHLGLMQKLKPEPIPTPDEIDTSPIPESILSRPDTLEQKHWEVIERILFVYAKLNPAISYVQGMNEMLCPLYYVLAHDGDEDSKKNAEADAFFLFTTLIGVFRDHFMKSLDEIQPIRREAKNLAELDLNIRKILPSREIVQKRNDSEIGTTMKRVMKKLKELDFILWSNMESKGLYPAYFLYRWLSVLFTMEFTLPDVIRLWDSILSDISLDLNKVKLNSDISRERFEFVIDFCCSMLIRARDDIINGDFGQNMMLLQHYPYSNIDELQFEAMAQRASTPAPVSTLESIKISLQGMIAKNEDGLSPLDASIKNLTTTSIATKQLLRKTGSVLTSSFKGMKGLFHAKSNSETSLEEVTTSVIDLTLSHEDIKDSKTDIAEPIPGEIERVWLDKNDESPSSKEYESQTSLWEVGEDDEHSDREKEDTKVVGTEQGDVPLK